MSSADYNREDAPVEATWNKECLFADWEGWKAALGTAKDTLAQIEQDSSTALEDSQALVEWLEKVFDFCKRTEDLSIYATMANAVDGNDMQAKGFVGQISGLRERQAAIIGRFEAEVLFMEDILCTWMQEDSVLYQHYLRDLLRKKQHMRSPEVEEILNLFSGPVVQINRTATELRNVDLKFKDAINSKGEHIPTRQASPPPLGIQDIDRERRRTAWRHYSDGYNSMINTFASNYIAYAKSEVMVAKARGFTSVLESRLFPSNLPVGIFHTLIDACKNHVGIWHKYWEVKRKALGVDQLHPYDIWAPIADRPPTISFRQGVDWIVESVKPLGIDYANTLSKGALQDRWVDWAPNADKRQGAFCGFCGPVPAVLMSYNDSMLSLSTLAHELGHAMHQYYRKQNQPYVYARHLLSGFALGETPSNLGQAMLRHYLSIEKADDPNFQLALVDEAINNFHRYFFIMPNLAQFELIFFDRIWEGQPVNAAILNDIMQGIYARGYGDTMTDDPKRTATTWAQFVHLYTPFYTFQYAVGISAAHSIADRIHGGVPGASDDFINMVSAGASLYPMDLFGLAGIDMTTSEPIEKAFGVLSSLVDQMDDLIR